MTIDQKLEIEAFFDESTNTVSYVVADATAKKCAIIDPVLNFDEKAGRTSAQSADAIIAYIADKNYQTQWILETHAHADHVTAASYLQQRLGGRTGVGAHIVDVQQSFQNIFNLEASFKPDGSQFDRLFDDHEQFKIGEIEARVLHTPGHTPACVTYIVGDAGFVGDTLFMPDYGTARCDFPGGDAATLYQSIQKLFALPPETRLFMCHDYKTPSRDHYAWETTVADELASNIHVRDGVSEDEFIAMREARDATLAMPRLVLPAIQINIRAGDLPPKEDNGVAYLKIPLNLL